MTDRMRHFLCFQLHDGALQRDYEVHSCGSMWRMPCEVHAPLYHSGADGMGEDMGEDSGGMDLDAAEQVADRALAA